MKQFSLFKKRADKKDETQVDVSAEKSIFKEGDKKLIEDATKELLSNPTNALKIFSKYKKIITETNK